jgi:hypothetical protein
MNYYRAPAVGAGGWSTPMLWMLPLRCPSPDCAWAGLCVVANSRVFHSIKDSAGIMNNWQISASEQWAASGKPRGQLTCHAALGLSGAAGEKGP